MTTAASGSCWKVTGASSTAFPSGSDLNERSLEIYRLRRILERAIADGASIADLPGPDADLVRLLLPGIETARTSAATMEEFEAAADRRFAALESGDPEEVGLWKQIVAASLEDFASFYRSLDITFDFVIGESFYAQLGLQLVDDWLQSGAAVQYGEARGRRRSPPPYRIRSPPATSRDSEFESLGQAIRKDVGAVVVRMSPSERYVVRRSDGRSIYATRDLAAVALRQKLFDPTCFIYVVGQEQKTHFERLFAASYQLGLADPARTTFDHIYFGFYVDAHTHKKLSSRESATGVTELFDAAQAYFRSRVSDRLVDGRRGSGERGPPTHHRFDRVQRPQAGHPVQRRDGHEEPDRHGGGLRQVRRRLRHLHGLPGGQHRPKGVGTGRRPPVPDVRQRSRSGGGRASCFRSWITLPSSPTRPSNETRPCWSGTCSTSATSTTRTTPKRGSSPTGA